MCLTALMLLLSEGHEKFIYQAFLLGTSTDTFVYTFGGTILIEASTRVEKAAYNFQWYKCDSKIRKMIVLIIARSQKEVGVKVPFFKASLDTFISVGSQLIC